MHPVAVQVSYLRTELLMKLYQLEQQAKKMLHAYSKDPAGFKVRFANVVEIHDGIPCGGDFIMLGTSMSFARFSGFTFPDPIFVRCALKTTDSGSHGWSVFINGEKLGHKEFGPQAVNPRQRGWRNQVQAFVDAHRMLRTYKQTFSGQAIPTKRQVAGMRLLQKGYLSGRKVPDEGGGWHLSDVVDEICLRYDAVEVMSRFLALVCLAIDYHMSVVDDAAFSEKEARRRYEDVMARVRRLDNEA